MGDGDLNGRLACFAVEGAAGCHFGAGDVAVAFGAVGLVENVHAFAISAFAFGNPIYSDDGIVFHSDFKKRHRVIPQHVER